MSAPLGPEVAEARNLHLPHDDLQHNNAEKVQSQVAIPEGKDIAKASPATTLVDTEISEEEKPKGLAFMLIISK